jgi:hypothetical protein
MSNAKVRARRRRREYGTAGNPYKYGVVQDVSIHGRMVTWFRTVRNAPGVITIVHSNWQPYS